MYYINMLMFTKQNRKTNKAEIIIKKALLITGYIFVYLLGVSIILISLLETISI